MIKVEYQAWDEKLNLVHDYKPFDKDKALKNGEFKAVDRYEYCLKQFMKLSKEERERGLIFGGVDYDFSFEEVEE